MLGLFAVVQAAFAFNFARLFVQTRPANLAERELPKAAVLISLRGAELTLRTSLLGLIQQRYPDFEVHIVVDGQQDPAWEVARQLIDEQRPAHVSLHCIQQRRDNCGLVCTAFCEAMQRVSPDCQIVATIDGDTMPHATWLRELVAPFCDPRVGATFGNRWFMPTRPTWGGLVRYLWNAAAVPPMQFFGIPWGGSFAIRTAALKDSGLLAAWSSAMVHDAPVKSALHQLGFKLRFVPSLMIPNRENCNVRFAHDFITRQMMWTRLYHPNWTPVFLHALVTSGLWLLALGILLQAALVGQATVFAVAAAGLAGYLAILLGLLAMLESAVRRALIARGEATPWLGWVGRLRLPLAIILTQGVYLSAVLRANYQRRVSWRGVTYHIRGPFDVHIQQDAGFQPPPADADFSL